MPRTILLFIALVIATAIAITQHYALENYWYWEYWWLDLLMHVAGGFVIATIAAAFRFHRAATLILIVLIVGVLWEIFENLIGATLKEPNIALDTSLDLLMDVIGAGVAYAMIGGWSRASPSPSPAERGESPGQTSS